MKTAWIQAGSTFGLGVGTIQKTEQRGLRPLGPTGALSPAPSVTGVVSQPIETTPSARIAAATV